MNEPMQRKVALRQQIAELVAEYADLAFASTQFVPGTTVIPPSGKVIGGAELHNMVEASLDGWLTTGRFNDAFERRLAAFLGVKHVLTVNSGSSANLLAFSALTSPSLGERALHPGDEVIAVAAGFPTTVNPILQFGAVPVFVDVDIPTYNIDASRIEAAIGPKTRAIMLAHTLGNPYNLGEVVRIAKKHNLWLIEDCCDALGSTYDGRLVGTFGDIGTLSFYPAHHITMGEGGAVFTNNDDLRRIMESFRDWGRDCYCQPGQGKHLRQALLLEAGQSSVRLRSQVHVLAHRLQPQDLRHAGGVRAGADGSPRRLHRRAQAQLQLPQGSVALGRGVSRSPRSHCRIRSILVRISDDAARRRAVAARRPASNISTRTRSARACCSPAT